MNNPVTMAYRTFLLFTALLWIMAFGASAQVSYYYNSNAKIQVTPTRSGQVIYNQLNQVSGGGITSEEFTDMPAYTSIAADDFEVPAGMVWNIHYIDVAGAFDVTGIPVNAVNVFFYSNNNGIPGEAIHTFTNITNVNQVPVNATTDKLGISLPSAVILPEGHYWLGVQLIGEFGTLGPWRWSEHVGLTIGNEYQWKNPQDGFGTGMVDWTASSLFSWGYFDLAFAFYGQAPANDLSMLSIESPVNAAGLGTAEAITVRLTNEGTDTQSGFNVSFTIDGGAPVSESVGAFSLSPNQASLYTFNATANLSTPGPHEIRASVNLATDTRHDNDSAYKLIYNLGTIIPMPSTGTSAITSCGATFTDSGGTGGDFGMDDNATTTIYPANAGDRIKLNFLSFDASWGGFSIYDGIDLNAPLIGTWNGTNSPGQVLALNAAGALTVHFEGPGWETRPGWEAYISCYAPVTDDFVALALNCNVPTMFAGDNSILSAKVQNYGTLSQAKTITFKANNIVIGTQTTPVLNPGDTAWVSVPFSPAGSGNYHIVASLPSDLGAVPNDTVSIEKYVYPFGTFYEDFEGSVFPPENWRHGGAWSQGNSPAVGAHNAQCYVDYTSSDTLVSPRLDIHAGDMLTFAAKTTPWWVGNLDVYWLNELNGQWNYMQTIPLSNFSYTQHTIDMTQAAGTNRIGFFVNVTDPFSWTGSVQLDNVLGQGITVHHDNHDLKAKALTGNSFYNINEPAHFQFVVRNDGLLAATAGTYTVKLMKDGAVPVELASVAGQALAMQQETTYDLSCTFTQVENISVYAIVEYAEDQFPVNNKSAVKELTGLAGGSTVATVGNDLYQVSWPIDFSYKKSLSETIYLNSEIMQSGVLFGIDYSYNFSLPETNVPVRIWVGETTVSEITDWIPATAMTLVYDGLLNYPAGKHAIYIPFQLPFNHADASKNLVIMTEKIDTHFDVNQNFYAYLSATNSSIEMSGDDIIPDPYAPTGGYATPTNPNIQFVFNTGVGALQGNVTKTSGAVFPGVQVSVDDLGITATTDATGHYFMPYVPAGAFQVTAEKFQYLPLTKAAAIVSNNTTTVDFVLSLLDLLSVSGRVVGNDNTSAGIANAAVSLSGYSNYSTSTDAQGYFTIPNVYSNNTYSLLINNERYQIYTGEVVMLNANVDLGIITLTEKLVIPYAITAVDQMNKARVTWYTPDITAAGVLSFDDGTNSNGYAGEPNEEVWLGNYFPVTAKATVSSFDVYWAGYGVNSPQTMRLDIFDEQANLLASSNEFTSGKDKWVNVDVPNLTLKGNYYVMIHWSGTFAQSTFLGFDTVSATTPNYAYLLYPGGTPQHLSDVTGEHGTFLIHANAMIGGKKTIMAPGSANDVNGFDVFRGLLSDIANAGSWPKLNANSSISTVYEDVTWPPAENGYYIYAIKALYSHGESELAFSNVLMNIYSGMEQSTKPQYSVYPNPAADFVNLENCQDTRATLFGMDGKLILTNEIHDHHYRMDLHGLSKGIYSLVIQAKSDLFQIKIVIK